MFPCAVDYHPSSAKPPHYISTSNPAIHLHRIKGLLHTSKHFVLRIVVAVIRAVSRINKQSQGKRETIQRTSKRPLNTNKMFKCKQHFLRRKVLRMCSVVQNITSTALESYSTVVRIKM